MSAINNISKSVHNLYGQFLKIDLYSVLRFTTVTQSYCELINYLISLPIELTHMANILSL